MSQLANTVDSYTEILPSYESSSNWKSRGTALIKQHIGEWQHDTFGTHN